MPDSGFNKQSRLLSSRDFSPVFQQPDLRVSNPNILMLVKRNQEQDARLGVVVSKKNARKAVQRNRIKRIFRESFRARKAEFGTIDIVMLARPQLDKRNNQEIRQLTDQLLDQLSRKLKT